MCKILDRTSSVIGLYGCMFYKLHVGYLWVIGWLFFFVSDRLVGDLFGQYLYCLIALMVCWLIVSNNLRLIVGWFAYLADWEFVLLVCWLIVWLNCRLIVGWYYWYVEETGPNRCISQLNRGESHPNIALRLSYIAKQRWVIYVWLRSLQI